MTHQQESGFSLIETMVALGILATGLLGLAGVFTIGMAHMATSSANLIAREKAREAVESVHTARDTRTITWAQIRNVSDGGIFLNGAQSVKTPGADGLVNTADDAAIEQLVQPGADGVLGTADDYKVSLSNFTRQVVISDIVDAGTGEVNQSLRQVAVTIVYKVGPVTRTYTLTTYISSIS
jgi:prepilin-type N-terminal cleavage/methylation domain-containing protein